MQCEVRAPRPSVYELVALIATAYLLSVLLGKLGLYVGTPDVAGNISVIAAIAIGLFAGTSACISVAGGLLLSSAKELTTRRTAAFALGRVLSYTALGGIIGALGQVFVLSPMVTSGLIILASVYMLYSGLNLLQIIPARFEWSGSFSPKYKLPSSPFFLGAATFFIPCGFTQSLQLYALTTGSVVSSALILGGFALGTVPALFVLGLAVSKAKGNLKHLFFHFAGVVVMLLGLVNLNNGLTLAGYSPQIALASAFRQTNGVDPHVRFENGEQVIRMTIAASPAYSPSSHFTVKSGIPVRLVITGRGTGCREIFSIPGEQLAIPLTEDVNEISFTPDKKGTLVFSCSMGMYPGTISVI